VVECQLPKLDVAGSTPVARSIPGLSGGSLELLRMRREYLLLPTDVGPLLRYGATHERDKKYQHQADRGRKGEDVEVGQ
jgi:hypothetical protein